MAKFIPFHPSVTSSYSIIIFVIVLAYSLRIVHSLTLESDVEALRSMLNVIDEQTIPASSYLSTWDFKGDPCESTGAKFLGILCSIPSDNSTSSRIVSIDLSGAGYHGTLSRSIGNLTELTSLDLSRNRLTGQLPDTLKNLKKLIRISIADNQFRGTIDGWIHELKRVERIDFSNNMLSGEIPARISGLRRLVHLSLSNNKVSGSIPDLNGLWQLRTLDLPFNMLEERLPRLPTSLTTLNLSHNHLFGHFAPLGMLKQLRSIDVSHNRFSGSISRGILSLPRLEYFNASLNGLTAIEVNNSRASVTPLRVLDAQWNNLHGHLPPNLVNLGTLRVINLSNNRLTGQIPMAYGERLGRPWRTLFLDDNFLSGALPPQFSRGMGRIKGSLADNCLRCPENVPLCKGRQRPPTDCTQRALVEN